MGQALAKNDPPMTTGSSSGYAAAILMGFALCCIVALVVFVYLNRNRGNSSVFGCKVQEIGDSSVLPSDIVTEQQHQRAASNPVVVVVHHSRQCGFCQKFRPVAEQVARESGGRYRVVFSDIQGSDDNQKRFQQLGEAGVPTYSKSGKVIGVGFRSAEQFRSLLESS